MNQTTKTINGKTYEVCLFPMENISITQKDHVGTHIVSYALDCMGKDANKDFAYAPCSMTRKYLYAPSGNVVWYESNEPVFRADGTIGYVTMMFIHCDDVDFDSALINVSQGQKFYREGTKGEADGNHIHMEVAWGKYTERYIDSSANNYGLKNCCPLQEVMCVDQSTATGLGYNGLDFKKSNAVSAFTGWKQHFYQAPTGIVNDWYYFIDGLMQTDWYKDTNGGWYFLNDGRFTDKEVGVMMRNKWVASGDDWYYVQEGGTMAINKWIDTIYYVLSDGKMAKNCQIKYNGKYYAFNNSGACLNTSGQTTQYNTTTYPLKS